LIKLVKKAPIGIILHLVKQKTSRKTRFTGIFREIYYLKILNNLNKKSKFPIFSTYNDTSARPEKTRSFAAGAAKSFTKKEQRE